MRDVSYFKTGHTPNSTNILELGFTEVPGQHPPSITKTIQSCNMSESGTYLLYAYLGHNYQIATVPPAIKYTF